MFVISCFERLEEDEQGLIHYINKRVFGFYADYAEAVKSLNTNRCDMNETIYNYAVIEEINQGIHPTVQSEKWFKWDKNKQGFFEIDEPEEVKMFTNFALG